MQELPVRLESGRFGLRRSSKLLAALAFCVLQVLTAAPVEAAPRARDARAILVSPSELEAGIVAGLGKVPELKFLREEAEKLGVEAHLFGGTAASFAHYVKQDLQRRKGDASIQADRFDYDFTSIFRSTQDLDVVIDGPRDKIDKLTRILRERYPHFIGDKANKWELRSLRESHGSPNQVGYKEALLDSKDFLLQNSDSHSTGLIRATKGDGSPAVRDLRDWNSKVSQFEKDVLEGRLHFYHSDQHMQTPRAKNGGNPEIFSVIRALTKAFQYDLTFPPETLSIFKKIIEETNWSVFQRDQNLQRRLVDISKKLFLHAVDLEQAWNVIDGLGLRAKLMSFDRTNVEGSLAYLMNKEPLRTGELGAGNGRTADELARSLGLESLIVAHETQSFQAYESITRSRAGVPNFFVSREGSVGEAAVHGWGVYSAIGRTGARGTQITVRMTIDPRAREGTDFVYVAKHGFILIRNRAAARVISEPIRLSTVGFLTMIATGTENFQGDLALLETFRRKLTRNPEPLKAADKNAIRKLLKQTEGAKKAGLVYEMEKLGLREFATTEDIIDGIRPAKVDYGSTNEKMIEIAFGRIIAEPEGRRAALVERAIGRLDSRALVDWHTLVQGAVDAGLKEYFTIGELALAKIGATYSDYEGGYYDAPRSSIKSAAEASMPNSRSMGLLLAAMRIYDWPRIEAGKRDKFVESVAKRFIALGPSLEDVEAMKIYIQSSPSARDVFLRARLATVKTADEFLHVFEGEARFFKTYDEDGFERGKARFDSGYFHEDTKELWKDFADRFVKLRPTSRDFILAIEMCRNSEINSRFVVAALSAFKTAKEMVAFSTDLYGNGYSRIEAGVLASAWKSEVVRFLSLKPSQDELIQLKLNSPTEVAVVIIDELVKRAKTANELMAALEVRPEKAHYGYRVVAATLIRSWDAHGAKLAALDPTPEHVKRIGEIAYNAEGFDGKKYLAVIEGARVDAVDVFQKVAERKMMFDYQGPLLETFSRRMNGKLSSVSAEDQKKIRAIISKSEGLGRFEVMRLVAKSGLDELVAVDVALESMVAPKDYRDAKAIEVLEFALRKIAAAPALKRAALLQRLIERAEISSLYYWDSLVKRIDAANLGSLLTEHDRILAKLGARDFEGGWYGEGAKLSERAEVEILPRTRTLGLAMAILEYRDENLRPPKRSAAWVDSVAKRIVEFQPTAGQLRELFEITERFPQLDAAISELVIKTAKTASEFMTVLRMDRRALSESAESVVKKHFKAFERLGPSSSQWESLYDIVSDPTLSEQVLSKVIASMTKVSDIVDFVHRKITYYSRQRIPTFAKAWNENLGRILATATQKDLADMRTEIPMELYAPILDRLVEKATTAAEVAELLELGIKFQRERMAYDSPRAKFFVEVWDRHIEKFARLRPTAQEAYLIELTAIYVPRFDKKKYLDVIEREKGTKTTAKPTQKPRATRAITKSCTAVFKG